MNSVFEIFILNYIMENKNKNRKFDQSMFPFHKISDVSPFTKGIVQKC